MTPRLPDQLGDAWRLDCLAFAAAIRPDPDLTIWEWADRHRVLSPEISAEPGPWRTGRVPYAREIMEALSPSHPAQEVTFVAGRQVCKTEIGNNFLGYIIDWAPGPAMMVLPTSNTGKRSSKTRLARMIDSSPRLREKIVQNSRDSANSVGMKDFPGGVLVIAGANSAVEMMSMPVRYLFEDELDEYPDDVDGRGPANEIAEKCTDTYVRRKIFRTSTPTERGRSKIWKHFERGDQRRYHVPCPHCAHEQVLVWPQMRWTTRRVFSITKKNGDLEDVSAETEGATERDTGELIDVWYECAHCAARIEERHKTEMLERGRWIAGAPGEGKKPASFHLSSLYSPVGWFSWWKAAEKRLEADQDPTGFLLKVWTNTVEGEPYAEANEQKIESHDIKLRAGPYALKKIPDGGLLLTAGVDVQGNRIEAIVKAWGRGEESWLVDYQVMYGDTESVAPWQALAEYLLAQTYDHEYGASMRVIATAVDSGFRTQQVYDFCRQNAKRSVFAVKGQSRPGRAILGRPSAQDVTHRGIVLKNGANLWPVGVDTAKARIYARLAIIGDGPGAMHFPLGLPDDYYSQLTAERLVTRYSHGYPQKVWEKDPGARNEAIDLEVYAYAAALYAGIARCNWDRLEASLKSSAGVVSSPAPAPPQRAEVPQPHVEVQAQPAAPAYPHSPGPAAGQFVQRRRMRHAGIAF